MIGRRGGEGHALNGRIDFPVTRDQGSHHGACEGERAGERCTARATRADAGDHWQATDLAAGHWVGWQSGVDSSGSLTAKLLALG